MNEKTRSFLVDTRPTKEVVVDSLTRDISIEACLFDLIDNSIDAARNTIFKHNGSGSEAQLPDSYSGFEIVLSISGERFSIKDNCGGISVSDLKGAVLRFGQRSKHSMGIGIFGLGLNRALFKLGKVSHLKTDTGFQSAELILNVDEYLKTEDWNLSAAEHPSSGKTGTTIEIRQLYPEIAQTLADTSWIVEQQINISRRYGCFIKKGLKIKFQNKVVHNGELEIRKDSPFPEEYKIYKIDGVSIRIRFGQHSEHRFSAEPDYNKTKNATLTDQFGWTIICNDRAIVVADKTVKTGWDTKFHTEFYGFIGIASFDAENPSKLPWDTTKFDVDMNNHVYQTALIDMRKFAEKWRGYSNRAKEAQRKGHPLVATSSIKKPSTTNRPPKKKDDKGAMDPKIGDEKPKPTKKIDHNQFITVLPEDLSERYCFDKHLALVHEAKNLDLSVFPYSGMALIRCLFEVSTIKYFERSNRDKLTELNNFIIVSRQKDGQKINDPKTVNPSIDEMIAYLTNNPDIWGPIKQSHLKHSLNRMSTHKKLMNSSVHNAWQQINVAEVIVIRDEVLPILRHLIES